MEFIVTLRFQYPAWDERDGLCFYVQAKTKAEARAIARTQALRDGHIPGVGKGRYSFVANFENLETDNENPSL